MNEPPRKRRKTSSPPQAQSSPLRKPPRRPSFASPTKTSLARNYPNLLLSRTPPRDEFRPRTTQAREFALDGASTEEGAEEDAELLAESHGRPEAQSQRLGTLSSLPSKRPPRTPGAIARSPLKEASTVQENRFTRPTEEVLNIDGQDKRAQIPRWDPEIEKRKQEKARLQREAEELEAQVSRCTKEIVVEQQRAAADALLPAQRADYINFITNISGAEAQDQRPTPVSNLLCSFLPFAGLAVPRPEMMQPKMPVASHRPVELKDPLSYLEMFTSFTFSTQLGLPRGEALPSSKRVHQKHMISISGPQKLLTAQVAVNIDCLTNEVIDMHVLRISSWAERELGAFMRTKTQERDLGNACWAVDSFWDITTKRAQYWHKCEKAFAQLLPGRTAVDNENTTTAGPKLSTLSRKHLSRHLGRDVLTLQDKHVLLKINWRIVFDWTGEAESNVDVECAVPAVWKEADASNTFRKVPETFESLLRTKGAFEATRIMVALLFSQ